jgi:hypothetical protein
MKLLKAALEQQSYDLAARVLVYGLLKAMVNHYEKKRRYYYDAALLSNLATEYGLSDTPPDFASQPSHSSPHIAENQLQGDMGDGRDAKKEPASIPSPIQQPDEPDPTCELLATQGWCLWQCDALDGEIIALVRDESVKYVPEGYVVYTKAEMAEIGRFKVPQSTIRLVHEAKKHHTTTVQSVIARSDSDVAISKPPPICNSELSSPCHSERSEESHLVNQPSGGKT